MDIGGGGVGKAGEEMLKELQKTQSRIRVTTRAKPLKATPSSSRHYKIIHPSERSSKPREIASSKKRRRRSNRTRHCKQPKSGQINAQAIQASQKVAPTEAPKAPSQPKLQCSTAWSKS